MSIIHVGRACCVFGCCWCKTWKHACLIEGSQKRKVHGKLLFVRSFLRFPQSWWTWAWEKILLSVFDKVSSDLLISNDELLNHLGQQGKFLVQPKIKKLKHCPNIEIIFFKKTRIKFSGNFLMKRKNKFWLIAHRFPMIFHDFPFQHSNLHVRKAFSSLRWLSLFENNTRARRKTDSLTETFPPFPW